MSIADRFVTEYMPAWLRRTKQQPVVPPTLKRPVRRPALASRPTAAFKPKLNPEQYSTHL